MVSPFSDLLILLQDVITSKRHRTWQKILEQIMIRYIDLCVDLKKGRYAKDGLIHYRNVCQQVNVSSLEEVIKYFLKTATDKAEEAQSKADLVGLWLSLKLHLRADGVAATPASTSNDSTAHLDVAQIMVQTVTNLDVEDLEVDATPEDLMLSYVSGEKGKVRLRLMAELTPH